MKYYIYISDTKVDMLYPQISKPLLKKIASNLSIDLKLFGAEVSVASNSSPSDETRYAKVRIVSEYIEKNLDVGSVDAPSTYFKGSLLMQWGPTEENENVVYFGGFTRHTIFGLAGSMGHVIGSDKGESFEMGYSYLYAILTVLEHEPRKPVKVLPETQNYYTEEAILGVENLTREMKGPKQQLEFLAKTLLQGSPVFPRQLSVGDDKPSYVVLGTPIYVAIAD